MRTESSSTSPTASVDNGSEKMLTETDHHQSRRLPSPLTDELRVNTYTAILPSFPRVSTFSNGGFVIAWVELSPVSDHRVYARRYWPSGNALGNKFRVNTYTSGLHCSIGAFNDGSFLIAWSGVGQDNYANEIYARRFSSNGLPITGEEFRVNTYTVSAQHSPSVATFSDGRFIITWVSAGQDGSRAGVYAQRYNSNGMALGQEFRVNTYTIDDQMNPSVGTFSDGSFVITWSSHRQDGSGYGIYAQRYNTNGTKVSVLGGSVSLWGGVSGEFRASKYTKDYQASPSIGTFSDGSFVIAWNSLGQDGSGAGIYARRFSAGGLLIAGDEFQVNTYTASGQMNPAVGTFRDGSFVITWDGYGQDGFDSEIYAQRYNVGGIKMGDEFRLNAYTTGEQAYATVGTFSDGRFVAVWSSHAEKNNDNYEIRARLFESYQMPVNTMIAGSQEYPSITRLKTGDFVITWQSEGQDGNLTGIYAQRYSSTGTLQGSEFRVNTYTTNFQNYSSVSGLSAGDFVVTWSSIAQDDRSNSGVFAQRYTSTGLPQGVEFQVNTYTVSHQRYSRVAGLSTGDFVVAWAGSLQDGSNEGVFAQRYSTFGIKQGNEFQVNTYTLNHQSFPSLAGLTTGDFVITWHSYGQDGDRYGVYAQRYSSLGITQGPEFRVNTLTLGNQLIPDITAVGGNFVITWQGMDSDRTGIYARRYSNFGVAQGAEFLVNTYTQGYQQSPRIAGLSSGDFVIVWQSEGQDGSGYGVYGQYYAASGTASGSEFRINIPTLGNQLFPSVTGLSGKDFVVTWQDDSQDGSGAGIYARLLRNNQGSISPVLLDKEDSDCEELVEESKEVQASAGWGSTSNVKKQKLRGDWSDDQVLGFPLQNKWDEDKVFSPTPEFPRSHERRLQSLPASDDWSLDVKPQSEITPSSLLTGLGYGLAIVGAAGLGIGLAVQCWRTWQSWRKQGEDSSVSRISAYCGNFFSRTVPIIHSEQIKATAESSPTLGKAVNF